MTHKFYTVAMEGLELADPHAHFQYYADAEHFAIRKSREFKDVKWVMTLTLSGREMIDSRELFKGGKHIR